VDPLGTLVQVLDATKEGGLFFCTEMPYESHNITVENWIAIFESMKLDFIFRQVSNGIEVILQKTKDYISFPISYLNKTKSIENRQKNIASYDFSKLFPPLIKVSESYQIIYSSKKFFAEIFPEGLDD